MKHTTAPLVAAALLIVVTAGTGRAAIKKVPYGEVQVEIAAPHQPEPAFQPFWKAFADAVASRNAAALFALVGSPVVAINRALAIAEVHGAGAALDALQELAADGRLAEYQPYWAARAELLAKTGEHAEARHAYEIAIGLERDASVRRFLRLRQSALAP